MDLRGREASVRRRHPATQRRAALLKRFGVTPYQREVEVGLGALFMMGGVHINARCETVVAGLYAAGEVSANVHGAKRVPGNAFTEMIVFGARAGTFAAQAAGKMPTVPEAPQRQLARVRDDLKRLIRPANDGAASREIRRKVRAVMGEYAHMIRDAAGLQRALAELQGLEKELPLVKADMRSGLKYNQSLIDCIDLRANIACAQAVCRAALARGESRGFHFRSDFAEERPEWQQHTVIRWSAKSGFESSVKPVSQ